MLLNDGSDPDIDPVKLRYIEILQTIQHGQLNRKRLAAKLGIPDSTLKRDLSKLIKLELVQYKGSAKSGWYELTQKVIEQL